MGFPEHVNEYLLRGISPLRVRSREGGSGKQLSYLEGWEVRAHLNRVFGFGNWGVHTDAEVLYAEEFVDQREKNQWRVGAKAKVVLLIQPPFRPDVAAQPPVVYEDVAAAEAINPNRGEATDQALKSAATDGLKRCAANLGDQFGLSLYRGGSTTPVVQTLEPWAGVVADAMKRAPSDNFDTSETLTERAARVAPEDAVEEAPDAARARQDDEAESTEPVDEKDAAALLREKLGAEPVSSGAFDGGTSEDGEEAQS